METPPSRDVETWWTRPCGGFDVLRQAVPLIISSGSISLMNFTDRMFLNWTGSEAMSASMQGGMLFWSTVAIPSAIAMFATTFVAQYHGSGNNQRIGPVVWQGIWLGFAVTPILFLLEPWLTELFVLFKDASAVDVSDAVDRVALKKTYFHIMLWGSAAVISGEAAAAFFRGRGKMRVEMGINLFCVVLNVVLDYCMIFGKFGFPAWGLAGAAYATIISQWVRFSIYIFLIFLADWERREFNVVRGMIPDFKLLGRLFYFGTPSSSYTFVDTITFTLFILIIGGLGPVEEDATTLAFTLNAFSFMPLVGIGIVVTSMVGNQLGDNKPELARRATNTALIIGCIYTGMFGMVFILFPGLPLAAFEKYADPEKFAAIYDLSIVLLRFIALYLFFDSCSIVFSSALRGAGDTMYVMRIVFALAPLLPLLCFIGIRYYDFGVIWCWGVLTANVFAYCACFSFRFLGKRWEKMRVIEKELQKK